MRKIDRTGEVKYNKWNNEMTIISYNGVRDILVKFKNGYLTKSNYRDFKNGTTMSPYDKTIYNIGYIGEGKYKSTDFNNKLTVQYQYWSNIFKRCYDKKELIKYPTYKNCYICEEWHNFQVFGQWFDKNHYKIGNERMCLDKDILVKGNKIYSPETCVFVPQRINILFTKSDAIRGNYPIGVTYPKRLNKYQARCSILNENHEKKSKHLGYYNTSEDAFYLGYKPFKEFYIKQVADDYKDKIPEILYQAMYKWIVEIDD